MTTSTSSMDGQKKLDQLKNILLKDEREELMRLKKELEEREANLNEKVAPLIEEHIEFLKKNFPEEFKSVVDKQIESKIRDSQEELIAVIYPAMGAMVKKYVGYQMALLRESIDENISKKGPIGWFRRKFLGVKESEWAMAEEGKPVIEGIYIIEKGSGLLISSASGIETMDEDLMAGMLTAIRSFAEDAFMKGEQKVDTIEYENLSIFIQSYPTFYIAASLSGKLTNRDKSELENELLDFVNQDLNRDVMIENESKELVIRKKITDRFLITPRLDGGKTIE